MESFLVNQGIWLALLFVMICALLIVAFTIFHTAVNLSFSPKDTVKSILGFVVFFVILLIIYMMASGDTGGIFQKFGLTSGQMKLVEGGILAGLLFTVGAFIFMVIDAILSFVR